MKAWGAAEDASASHPPPLFSAFVFYPVYVCSCYECSIFVPTRLFAASQIAQGRWVGGWVAKKSVGPAGP